ncbi:MAG TPA: hypothetical protein VFR97_03875 [Capillimicrobium sp.]|nr:hypothetical protein [Capillimicrobium sp.]
MRNLTRAALTAACLTAALAAASAPAHATRMFTSPSKTTLAAVGTTMSMTTPSFEVRAGGITVSKCNSGSMTATLADNGSSSGQVDIVFTSSTFSSCTAPVTMTHNGMTLSTQAASDPFNGAVTDISVTAGSVQCTGDARDSYIDPTGTGYVYWRNNGSNNAEIELQNGGPLSSSLGTCTVDGRFTLGGATGGNLTMG